MVAVLSNTVTRWWSPEMRGYKASQGFSLMEVMIGVFLSTLVMSGVIQLLGSSTSTYRLQLNQGRLEESARYARDILASHIAQAGYQPEPWDDLSALAALTDETADGQTIPGDVLGLQRWSMRNCYGNENPVTDAKNRASFYLLQTRFRVNASNNLAISCRYGPDASNLQTQINNFGLVEGVESMQVLYAEDLDGDDVADTWIKAQAWQQESNIRSIKIALLLSTSKPFKQAASEQITLLDRTIATPADGHLRRVSTLTSGIRGRLQ